MCDLGAGIKTLSFPELRATSGSIRSACSLSLLWEVQLRRVKDIDIALLVKNIDNGAIIKAKCIWKSKCARLLSWRKSRWKHLQPDHHWALTSLATWSLCVFEKICLFPPAAFLNGLLITIPQITQSFLCGLSWSQDIFQISWCDQGLLCWALSPYNNSSTACGNEIILTDKMRVFCGLYQS